MKLVHLVYLLMGFFLWQSALSQGAISVRTEAASNRYKNYSAATTGDTLFKKAAAVVGSSTPTANTGVVGYLVGLFVGSPVASDTFIVKNGTGTVIQIILPSSGMIVDYYPIPTRLDTSLIYIQKKASNATLFYRLNF